MNIDTATDTPEPRTKAWTADEYIQVDGMKLVYTSSEDEGLRVRFPGGLSCGLAELLASGRSVILPTTIRFTA